MKSQQSGEVPGDWEKREYYNHYQKDYKKPLGTTILISMSGKIMEQIILEVMIKCTEHTDKGISFKGPYWN